MEKIIVLPSAVSKAHAIRQLHETEGIDMSAFAPHIYMIPKDIQPEDAVVFPESNSLRIAAESEMYEGKFDNGVFETETKKLKNYCRLHFQASAIPFPMMI